MISELPGGKTRLITPYRIGVSIVLAAAFAAIYVGFISAQDPEPTIARPSNVVSFSPGEGETALRQSRIHAELKPGYVGILVIDGIEIPEDQLEHLEGSNHVGFTPGEGTDIEELKPGRRCATVVFWEPELGRATAESFGWCWQVH